jgi:hypothetical protein
LAGIWRAPRGVRPASTHSGTVQRTGPAISRFRCICIAPRSNRRNAPDRCSVGASRTDNDARPDNFRFTSSKSPEVSVRVLAANFARAVLDTRPSKNGRGRRECRVKASPMAPVHNKKHGEGTTGSAGSSGIPCAMVLTLMSRSPWGPGFLAPIARSVRHAGELGLSVGRPGPRDFASASASFVRAHKARATPSRPPHPALTFGDDWP